MNTTQIVPPVSAVGLATDSSIVMDAIAVARIEEEQANWEQLGHPLDVRDGEMTWLGAPHLVLSNFAAPPYRNRNTEEWLITQL